MRRNCAIILFLVFTHCLIEMAQSSDANCGKHGDPCNSDSDCCPNIKCHKYANRCQVDMQFPPQAE